MSKTPEKTADDALSDLDFEAAMQALQAVVEKMDSADLPLEEMLKNYERGMALSAVCQQALDAAAVRIEQITEDSSGEIKATPMPANE